MAVKPSLTGITPENFTGYDRTPGTGVNRQVGSADREARRVTQTTGRTVDNSGPVQTSSPRARGSQGTKVAGATSIRGGRA